MPRDWICETGEAADVELKLDGKKERDGGENRNVMVPVRLGNNMVRKIIS